MDAFAKASALYWYCANYHEGQASELYGILSVLPYEPGCMQHGPDGDEAEEIYNMLEAGNLNPADVLEDVMAEVNL